MRNKIIITILVILAILIVFYIPVLKEALLLIIISFIIAYAFKPFFLKFTSMGVNRQMSALIILSVIIIFFVVILAILVPAIVKEASNFENTLNNITKYINHYYEKHKALSNGTTKNIINSIYSTLTRKIESTFSSSMSNISNIGSKLLYISVIPIIIYYLLADCEKINNKVILIFPIKTRNIVKRVASDIDKTLNRYIISQFILSILMTVFTFIILIVLKVNFPLTLSIINGVFNVIPYFGPILGGLPAIIMALLKSPQTAIWAFLLISLLQQIEGNIISPKITGDSVDMHPLWVIVLVIIGEKVMGFWGMLLAIPIGVIFKIIYDDIIYYMY